MLKVYTESPEIFYHEGQCIDEDIFVDDFYFLTSVIIAEVSITARDVPTGQDITIDILKDGVETGKILILTDGSKSKITSISGLEFLTSNKFGLKIKSVGSTNPGGGLCVRVYYWLRP